MKNIIIILLALLSFNTWADCYPLIAGQNIEMGSVCVENTETDITVTYQADSG